MAIYKILWEYLLIINKFSVIYTYNSAFLSYKMNIILRCCVSIFVINLAFPTICYSGPFDSLMSKAKEMKDSAEKTAAAAKDKVGDAAAAAKEKGADAVGSVTNKAAELKDNVANKATDLKDSASNKVDAVKKEGEKAIGSVANEKTSAVDNLQVEVSQETKSKIDPIFERTSSFIDASGRELTDDDMIYLAAKLVDFSNAGGSQITLDLSKNSLTAQGVGILVSSLKDHPKLISVLDLSHNKLEDDVVRILFEEIGNLPVLSAICLVNVGMTGQGLQSIVESIVKSQNTILQHMDLSDNPIEPEYLIMVFDNMKKLHPQSCKNNIILSRSLYEQINGVEIPSKVSFQ
jgi:hypothetical protein